MQGSDDDDEDEQDEQITTQVETQKENDQKALMESTPEGEQPSNLALVATKSTKKHHHHHHQQIEVEDVGMSADMFG